MLTHCPATHQHPLDNNTHAQGALQHILMRSDVPGAVSFVEGEIQRLLTGHVSVWELAMTGGLWRVTGQQLERAAAAGEQGLCAWGHAFAAERPSSVTAQRACGLTNLVLCGRCLRDRKSVV